MEKRGEERVGEKEGRGWRKEERRGYEGMRGGEKRGETNRKQQLHW